MKTSILIQVFAGFVINLIGQSWSIESTAHEWDSLAIEQTEYGEKRAIFQGKSDGFDYVDANAITLGGMTSTHWVQVPKDFEELLIVKEGTVQYVTNQKSETLGAGSVALAFPEDEYKIENSKETKATYYIIRWKGEKGANRAYQGTLQPIVKNWNNIEFQKTAKGGRRVSKNCKRWEKTSYVNQHPCSANLKCTSPLLMKGRKVMIHIHILKRRLF